MESSSIWHWLIVIVFCVLTIYPYVRIVKRTGHSGWWVLTGLLLIVNFVMLWVFAFARWPAIDSNRRP
ncbi:hypothetical protein P9239_16255 [Caballeronia sp. LZ062]|uniref:hypothetical protein n=1 Tax=unclassified Caballeronia TaxID=2646786 RepID=UPI00285869FD|nr:MULTISPECIES: hypothetical protein [unclassified Caballeronia]MDR5853570.1 hypothetical protein [Caballeronia sp. LZ050]MDR5871896.1 hypothetical protein [Caballeronia sp. LZ062]